MNNSKNVYPTIGKTIKAFPYLLKEEKKLFDFTMLDGVIPESIIKDVCNKAMKNANIFNCLSVVDATDRESGKQYYLYFQYIPYVIRDRHTGKKKYEIMQVSAYRISIFDLNIYGYVIDDTSDCLEAGYWTESTLEYINEIEIA